MPAFRPDSPPCYHQESHCLLVVWPDTSMLRITIKAVQQAVAEHFGMSIAELKSKNSSRDVVAARQIAMYLTRQLTQMSLSEIGRRFGGKHHTTVIYAVKQITEQSQSDKILRTTLAELQGALSGQTSLTDCGKESVNILHL